MKITEVSTGEVGSRDSLCELSSGAFKYNFILTSTYNVYNDHLSRFYNQAFNTQREPFVLARRLFTHDLLQISSTLNLSDYILLNDYDIATCVFNVLKFSKPIKVETTDKLNTFFLSRGAGLVDKVFSILSSKSKDEKHSSELVDILIKLLNNKGLQDNCFINLFIAKLDNFSPNVAKNNDWQERFKAWFRVNLRDRKYPSSLIERYMLLKSSSDNNLHQKFLKAMISESFNLDSEYYGRNRRNYVANVNSFVAKVSSDCSVEELFYITNSFISEELKSVYQSNGVALIKQLDESKVDSFRRKYTPILTKLIKHDLKEGTSFVLELINNIHKHSPIEAKMFLNNLCLIFKEEYGIELSNTLKSLYLLDLDSSNLKNNYAKAISQVSICIKEFPDSLRDGNLPSYVQKKNYLDSKKVRTSVMIPISGYDSIVKANFAKEIPGYECFFQGNNFKFEKQFLDKESTFTSEGICFRGGENIRVQPVTAWHKKAFNFVVNVFVNFINRFRFTPVSIKGDTTKPRVVTSSKSGFSSSANCAEYGKNYVHRDVNIDAGVIKDSPTLISMKRKYTNL